MIRRFLMTASVLCLALPAFAPAFAQDEGAITVIQDDGTKVTVPIEGVDPVLPGEMDAPPQAAAPVPPAEKPLIVPEVETRFVDPIVEQPARAVHEEAPAPKSSAKKPNHPKPPRVPMQKAVKQSLPPGTEISERQATSIAMDAAPASSGFTSSRQTYQGKPVYVVTFKTDEGPYDVLVMRPAAKSSSAPMSRRMRKSRPRRGICRPTGNHITRSPLASLRLHHNYY